MPIEQIYPTMIFCKLVDVSTMLVSTMVLLEIKNVSGLAKLVRGKVEIMV